MFLSFSHMLQSDSDVKSIQSLEDAGFNGCEIMFPEREPLDQPTKNLMDEVSGTTNLQLTAHLPYKNINIASEYQYVRESSTELLTKVIDDISDFVDIVTLHMGYAAFGVGSVEKAIENNILSLTRICDHAEQYEILVGAENATNERHMVGKTFPEMERLIHGVGRGNLGITFDIGHANLTGNIDDYLDKQEMIVQMHAHDNFGFTDEHLVIGEGKIRWGPIYDRIREWECPMVLEQATVEAGKKSMEYLHSLASESGTYARQNGIVMAIRAAQSPKEMLHLNNDLVALAEDVLTQGGTGSMINHIVSSCRDAMTCQMSEIILARLGEAKKQPHVRFALLATGSFGRMEMSVESDQDTILVIEDGADEAAREYYREFAEELVDGLAASGFDRCRGNMMASNPKWRGTTTELVSHLDDKYERSVIMDTRYVFGDRPLAHRFLKTLHHRLRTDPYYAIELAIPAINADVGLEGDSFKIEYRGDAEDLFNIKKYGFRIFSASIKALSVKHAINRTNVTDRLWKLRDIGVIDAEQFKRFAFAYDQLTRVMMLGYVHNIRRGVVSNEFVRPYELSRKDQLDMKESLRIVRELQKVVSSEFAIAKTML